MRRRFRRALVRRNLRSFGLRLGRISFRRPDPIEFQGKGIVGDGVCGGAGGRFVESRNEDAQVADGAPGAPVRGWTILWFSSKNIAIADGRVDGLGTAPVLWWTRQGCSHELSRRGPGGLHRGAV